MTVQKKMMKPFNLEEYLKNPSKRVVTRSGDTVKILCVHFDDSDYPIIARVEGTSFPNTPFTKDGKFIKCRDTKYDLFFASGKREGWINIFHGKDGPLTGNVIFASKEEAEESSRHCCGFTEGLYMTSGKVEWEE